MPIEYPTRRCPKCFVDTDLTRCPVCSTETDKLQPKERENQHYKCESCDVYSPVVYLDINTGIALCYSCYCPEAEDENHNWQRRRDGRWCALCDRVEFGNFGDASQG